ncbi:hypothetical protein BH24ACT21_BH24ACT21_15100 [soil metagenome]
MVSGDRRLDMLSENWESVAEPRRVYSWKKLEGSKRWMSS